MTRHPVFPGSSAGTLMTGQSADHAPLGSRAMGNFAKGTRVVRTHVIRESSVTTQTRNLSSGVGHVQKVTAEMECAVFPQLANNGHLHVSKTWNASISTAHLITAADLAPLA